MATTPPTDRRTLDEGHFFCPKCKASTRYVEYGLSRAAHMDVWQWAIARFRWEELRDYVECVVCSCRFEAGVLQRDMQKLLGLVAEAAALRRQGVAYPAIRARIITLAGSEHAADKALQVLYRD